MIVEIKTISLGFVNCYLVNTRGGFVLVDTGIRGKRNDLEKALQGAGCTPGNLNLIALTHGDIDHTGNGAYLREKYKTRIAMHKNDFAMVEYGEMRPRRRVMSLPLRLMHRAMEASGGFKKMIAKFEKFKPDLNLEEGQSLKEFGFDAIVLHIPGHSKGSIGILTGTGDLISGDILENRDHAQATKIIEDETELAASIKRLSTFTIKTVYPGHGKPFPWEQFQKNRKQ